MIPTLPKQHFSHLIRMAAAVFYSSVGHYRSLGLQFMEVPAIVGITGACENVDTLFKVGNRLELPLFFTQTGQLALEQALQYSHGVYTIIHSGRDEEEEDDRHLRQFLLTEEEFDCAMADMTRKTYDEEKMYEALLFHVEKIVKAMIRGVAEAEKKVLADEYGRNPGALKEIMARPFLRIRYEDAVAKLQGHGFADLRFGDDLIAVHEAKIVELVNKEVQGYGETIGHWSPVFIMRYPKEIKFFNMKVSEKDPRVVLSADLILPYSGEAVGSAVREHDGVKLLVRLLTSKMYRLHEQRGGTYDDFRWYTEDMILSRKTLPHAGYGVGNERVLQFVLGLSDIRDCSLFSLISKQAGDWDVSRRGMLPIVSHRKTVLLSIGREEDKRRLLESIKKMSPNGHLFYATAKTHDFLAHHGIPSTRVYKISEDGSPNLDVLLRKNMFDLIINIPTDSKRNPNEQSDGKFIRRTAVETGTTLITDPNIADSLLISLGERENGVSSIASQR